MMGYLVQSRDRTFVKRYGCLSFAKNMGKGIGKNISKSLSGKYCQKLFDHAKETATNTFKIAWKRTIQKPEEATDEYKSFKKFTTR